MLFLQVLSVQHGGGGRQRERHGGAHAREPGVGEGPAGPGQHQQSRGGRQLRQGQQQWACGQCTGESGPRGARDPERAGHSGALGGGRRSRSPEWGCWGGQPEEGEGPGGMAAGVALMERCRPGSAPEQVTPGKRGSRLQPSARHPVPTVCVAGRGLGPAAAAAVLPVVPAVQLHLPLQLLLPGGECLAGGGLRGSSWTDHSRGDSWRTLPWLGAVRAPPKQCSCCHRASSVSAHPTPCPFPCPYAPCGGLPRTGLLSAAVPPPTLPTTQLLSLAFFLRLLGAVLCVCS